MTKTGAKDDARRALRDGYTPSLDGGSGTIVCFRCRADVVGYKHPSEKNNDLAMLRALTAHLRGDCAPTTCGPETAA